MQGLQGSQTPLNFDVIEKILTEVDKYNKIKELFENFKFEKKLNVLKDLNNLVTDFTSIDENFVNDLIDLEEFKKNIEKFKINLKEFDDLLNEIMDQMSDLNGSVEEMLEDDYETIPVEIFNVIEKFYQDFYGEDYEDNYKDSY